MDESSIIGYSGLILSILGIIYSAVNHKHIKSKCCGRVIDFSIDVENTNPEEDRKREEEEKKKKEEEEKKKKEEEENKKKEEEEKKKKEEEEKKKKEEEENKKKISYTPHVFKIQPLHF
jgi:flagellar biosynthesis GTPase FlhF